MALKKYKLRIGKKWALPFTNKRKAIAFANREGERGVKRVEVIKSNNVYIVTGSLRTRRTGSR